MRYATIGMKKVLCLLVAIVLSFFSASSPALAATFPIVATNIESTQLLVSWDGVNNAACEHAVACDPNDPESYVLDVNTLEQRDILNFYDAGYNVGVINWTSPLAVGHTYKVQMRGQGHYRISQEFTYTPTTFTNFTSGTAIINQINVLSTTNIRLFGFSPSLQTDSNCQVNGTNDLSIDTYVNHTLRQTFTGSCTYGVVAPGVLDFSTSSVYGSGNYYFVIHSASTGNVWNSGSIDYTVPPFAISNLTFNHGTGQYSFNYSGYAGGDITGESVSIHASDGSWGYNDEPATCTGGASGSGTCSGTFNLSQGTFSCGPSIGVGIYGYHLSVSVHDLINPDQACVSPQDLFPGATLGTLNVMTQEPNSIIGLQVDLPGYYLDCWNDFGFTVTIYDASTNMPVGSSTNPNPQHICGFLDLFHRNLNWVNVLGLTLPTGNYWLYLHSNNNPGTWVTNAISFTAQTPPNQAPTVTFTADNLTINEGDTFTAHGSFTDSDSTAWTATVDYGDGSGVQPLPLNPDKTFSLSHLYVDNGSYTITVSITDNGNLTGTSNGSGGGVVVNNPAPTVPPITPPSNVGQNDPAVINVNFNDYGNQSHTATINWGDGSGNQSVPVSGNNFSSGHNYQNPGTYTVTVTITDSEGATTTQTLTITVLNVAPVVGTINFPSTVATTNSNSLSVDFTDQGTADTHTATINWGDGQTTNGVVTESNGSGSVSGSHAYAAPGPYTITVAVTDDDNGVGQNTAGTTAINQISAISPAGIWVGLKNSDDIGVKFDLKAEAFKGNTLIASGQLDSFVGGSSGFNNAHLATIPFNSFAPADLPAGSVLSITVSVRNACVGSGKTSGVARLWYNDSAAASKISTTIGGSDADYYLRDLFALATTAGPGPKKTIDVQAGAKCSSFKPFGTWTTTL